MRKQKLDSKKANTVDSGIFSSSRKQTDVSAAERIVCSSSLCVLYCTKKYNLYLFSALSDFFSLSFFKILLFSSFYYDQLYSPFTFFLLLIFLLLPSYSSLGFFFFLFRLISVFVLWSWFSFGCLSFKSIQSARKRAYYFDIFFIRLLLLLLLSTRFI